MVFIFLAYFTLYYGLSFIHLIRTDSNEFFLVAVTQPFKNIGEGKRETVTYMKAIMCVMLSHSVTSELSDPMDPIGASQAHMSMGFS